MRFSALIVLMAVACLLTWSETVFADGPSEQAGKVDSPVSPLLSEFIEQREAAAGQAGQQPSGDAVTRSQAEGGVISGVTTKDAPSPDSAIAEPDTTDDPVRFDSSGNVQVYIRVENTNDGTLQQIRDLGATIEVVSSDWNVLQAWVPTSVLDELAALNAVQEITPPDYGVTKSGRVNTEGDAIHRADLVRAFSGLTGDGVRVGAISNGVSSWTSARSSGDLPRNIEIDPDRSGGGDEGTALLEVVHDLAPGADLAFSGPDTSLEFVQSILWLANDAFNGEGSDVIVDDFGYYDEPYFEDGPLALAAIDAVAGGAVFVSAAGNSARRHYEADFVDGGSGYHDFDPSPDATDTALRVSTEGVRVILQWNDRFGSSGNDYDLYICRPGLRPTRFNLRNDQCDGSTRVQDGGDDPIESMFASFGDEEVDIYVRKFPGQNSEDKRLEIFMFGGVFLEHGVPEGGIIGHPAAEGVIAVSAVGADDPGHDDLESFSDWDLR